MDSNEIANEIEYYNKLFSFQNTRDIKVEDIIYYTNLKAELKKQEEWDIIPYFKWLQKPVFCNEEPGYLHKICDYILDYFYEDIDSVVL